MARSALSLKAKALTYLAQREHSRIELRRKLLSHIDRQRRAAASSPLSADTPAPALPTEQEIDELLDWLAAKDLLSAGRFVETRVSAREVRFGNLRIHQELAQHGMALDAETAQRLKDSELARARAVWAKRFGSPAVDAAERARQMRFLSARGFSSETVRRVVRTAGLDD
ncbi:regulatory protein RecX [Methylibium sp.]|uniref:regulatory protein RecX n=1 Tax=Methylibium sp. TaxID=2067992 RepID=UPI003D0B13D6